MFYGCPLYRENRSCGFFRWLDSTEEDWSYVILKKKLDVLEQEFVQLKEDVLAHIDAQQGCKMVKFVKWIVVLLVNVMILLCWIIWVVGKKM